jgi:hypothetical protein
MSLMSFNFSKEFLSDLRKQFGKARSNGRTASAAGSRTTTISDPCLLASSEQSLEHPTPEVVGFPQSPEGHSETALPT